MDMILRERQVIYIKDCIKKGLAAADDNLGNVSFRLGAIEGYMKSIKYALEDIEKDVIGTTGIIWIKQDVIKSFKERFDREPTDEELDEILDNLNLNEVGEESGIADGWETIAEALDEFENNHTEGEE